MVAYVLIIPLDRRIRSSRPALNTHQVQDQPEPCETVSKTKTKQELLKVELKNIDIRLFSAVI